MGWVIMSERELNRVEVLSQVDDGRLNEQLRQRPKSASSLINTSKITKSPSRETTN